MRFNQFLKKAREERGITKAELARTLKLSIQYLVEVESGRSKPPTLERCNAIAKSLKLSAEEKERFLNLAVQDRASEELKPFVMKEPDAPYGSPPDLGLPASLYKGRTLRLIRITEVREKGTGLRKGDLALVDIKTKPRPGDLVSLKSANKTTLCRFPVPTSNSPTSLLGLVIGVVWGDR